MWEKILMTKEKIEYEYKITYCVFPLSNNKKNVLYNADKVKNH